MTFPLVFSTGATPYVGGSAASCSWLGRRRDDGRYTRSHLRHQWTWGGTPMAGGEEKFLADTDATAVMAGRPAAPLPAWLTARPVLAVVSVVSMGRVAIWTRGLVAVFAEGVRWAHGSPVTGSGGRMAGQRSRGGQWGKEDCSQFWFATGSVPAQFSTRSNLGTGL
jgi:hypothetical protein